MAKIPYLIRRKNIFYFRLVIPVELRDSFKVREVIRSLKTENREEASHQALKLAAYFKALLHDLKLRKVCEINFNELSFSLNAEAACNDTDSSALEMLPKQLSMLPASTDVSTLYRTTI